MVACRGQSFTNRRVFVGRRGSGQEEVRLLQPRRPRRRPWRLRARPPAISWQAAVVESHPELANALDGGHDGLGLYEPRRRAVHWRPHFRSGRRHLLSGWQEGLGPLQRSQWEALLRLRQVRPHGGLLSWQAAATEVIRDSPRLFWVIHAFPCTMSLHSFFVQIQYYALKMHFCLWNKYVVFAEGSDTIFYK
jgi:hypothetical protein